MRTGHKRHVRGGLRLMDCGMEIIINMNTIFVYNNKAILYRSLLSRVTGIHLTKGWCSRYSQALLDHFR